MRENESRSKGAQHLEYIRCHLWFNFRTLAVCDGLHRLKMRWCLESSNFELPVTIACKLQRELALHLWSTRFLMKSCIDSLG